MRVAPAVLRRVSRARLQHQLGAARPRGCARGHDRRSEELACKAHIFTNYKQGWVTIPADVPQWGEMAPIADFSAALMR